MFVSNFFLVIGTSPLAIYDILVLVLARCQGVSQFELVHIAWVSFHGRALLPIAERTNYEHFVATLSPSKHVLGWTNGLLVNSSSSLLRLGLRGAIDHLLNILLDLLLL